MEKNLLKFSVIAYLFTIEPSLVLAYSIPAGATEITALPECHVPADLAFSIKQAQRADVGESFTEDMTAFNAGTTSSNEVQNTILSTIEGKVNSVKLQSEEDGSAVEAMQSNVQSLINEINGVRADVEQLIDDGKFKEHVNDESCKGELGLVGLLVKNVNIVCLNSINQLNNNIVADFNQYQEICNQINEKNLRILRLRGKRTVADRGNKIEKLSKEVKELEASIRGTFSVEQLKKIKDEFYASLSKTILDFSLNEVEPGIVRLRLLSQNCMLSDRLSGSSNVKNEIRLNALDFVRKLTEKYCAEEQSSAICNAIEAAKATYDVKSNSVSRDVLALVVTDLGNAFTAASHVLNNFVDTSVAQQMVSIASIVFPDADMKPLLKQASRLMCYGGPAAAAATIAPTPAAGVFFAGTYFAGSIGKWLQDFGLDLHNSDQAFGNVVQNNAKIAKNGIAAKITETAGNIKRAFFSVTNKVKALGGKIKAKFSKSRKD